MVVYCENSVLLHVKRYFSEYLTTAIHDVFAISLEDGLKFVFTTLMKLVETVKFCCCII